MRIELVLYSNGCRNIVGTSLIKQISDCRRPDAVAILLAQVTKEMLWRHSCDVGLLVGVCRVRNRIVAIATSLDAVEDDADKD